MKVKVAKSAGFCIGVKRAVELVLRVADEHRGRRIFTHGPLIHNPQTVDMLRERGIGVMDSLSECEPKDIVVIRSHGISPNTRKEIIDAGCEIFDATCPKVAFVHSTVKKISQDGYAVIVVGDPNHAEVIGIKDEAISDVAVVSSPEQVLTLPEWEKVVVVGQTTMDRRTFDCIVEQVKRKFGDVAVKNTLCSETSYRQDEIAELAKESDAFVVIGGKNSANTARLQKLALTTGLPTVWVETESELAPSDFLGIERVAVIAGASTPHWIISRVVERLETMHKKFLPPWRWQWLKNIAYTALRSNFFAGAATGVLTALIAENIGLSLPALRGVVAGNALFGTQNLFEYREWQGLALMDPSKVQFVRQTKKFLLPASFLALFISTICALLIGVAPLVLAGAIALFSLSYLRFSVFERLIPASIKDTALLMQWVLLVFILGAFDKPILLLPIVVLGGMRALVMGLKELETDRILQRKSLTAIFGEKFSIFAGIPALIIGIIPPMLAGYAILGIYASIVAMWLLAVLVAMRALRKGTYIEVIADSILSVGAILI